MEDLFNSIIAQWGVAGIIIASALYIIIDNFRNKKSSRCSDQKLDEIKTDLSTVKADLDNVKTELPTLKNQMDYFEKSIKFVNDDLNKKIINYNDIILGQIDDIKSDISNSPQYIIEELDTRAYNLSMHHNDQMVNQIKIAPQIHSIMGDYMERIGCDHMFLGLFHNGTSSISGVPFYKFDIVAEKFNPVGCAQDYEFGHMYKDVDILRHNKLPIELIQNKKVFYRINDDQTSELSSVDDILYRRMIGGGIKQIALTTIQKDKHMPIGFVGCVKFDQKTINFKELERCTEEISRIYNAD